MIKKTRKVIEEEPSFFAYEQARKKLETLKSFKKWDDEEKALKIEHYAKISKDIDTSIGMCNFCGTYFYKEDSDCACRICNNSYNIEYNLIEESMIYENMADFYIGKGSVHKCFSKKEVVDAINIYLKYPVNFHNYRNMILWGSFSREMIRDIAYYIQGKKDCEYNIKCIVNQKGLEFISKLQSKKGEQSNEN
jgi:hypothetical protein